MCSIAVGYVVTAFLLSRSWDKVYVVLKKGLLLFYKDQKHAKNEPETHYKGEAPVVLREAEVDVASDYTKKKHVFRFKLSNGAEYLFQAKEDAEMDRWIAAIKSAIETPQSPGPSRSQTMPAKGSGGGEGGEKKDESKKRSGLFTLKKK